jgi:neutral trehalase
MDEPAPNLINDAKAVLEANDQGTHTIPARGIYPHQWLWDSCFIAIGISHYDIERAQTEILSLLRGQWANGMMPNIIITPGDNDRNDIWHSWINPYSPDGISTSGITQPPVLAEAIVRIGAKLSIAERRTWYRTVLPSLIAYHSWLYNERDPHDEGLVLLIHPWETGTDNTPSWMGELHKHQMPLWIRFVAKAHLTPLFNLFRRDTKFVPIEERLSTIEALSLYSVQRRLRRKKYDISGILTHGLFAIEDLTFNSILIRANKHLREIAKTVGHELPPELKKSMSKTEQALEQLWDPYSKQYYSRNFITHELLKEPTIASLMPLYAGTIDKERADKLVSMLENKHLFGPEYPVPSVPINSPWFNEKAYWQGPTWINTNWLIIDGLKRMGYKDHADALTEATLELVTNSGYYEYFSSLNGSPAGSANFSWTAALTIDLATPAKRSRK